MQIFFPPEYTNRCLPVKAESITLDQLDRPEIIGVDIGINSLDLHLVLCERQNRLRCLRHIALPPKFRLHVISDLSTIVFPIPIVKSAGADLFAAVL